MIVSLPTTILADGPSAPSSNSVPPTVEDGTANDDAGEARRTMPTASPISSANLSSMLGAAAPVVNPGTLAN